MTMYEFISLIVFGNQSSCDYAISLLDITRTNSIPICDCMGLLSDTWNYRLRMRGNVGDIFPATAG